MASTTKEIKGVEINKNINYKIVDLAKYAVQVHNQQQNAHLTFIEVVKATIQPVVEGVLYYITLKASNLGVEQLYDAKVWVKESTHYIELQDFRHVVELKVLDTNNEKADSNVVDFAKFAIKEYNKRTNGILVFVKVVDASIKPVLDGELYYITLEALNFGVVQFYEAMVWAKASNTWPWLELVDFKPKEFLSTPADK